MKSIFSETESYHNIIYYSRRPYTGIHFQQIFAENPKAKRVAPKFVFLPAMCHGAGIFIYPGAGPPDQMDLSRCLEISSYFYAPMAIYKF